MIKHPFLLAAALTGLCLSMAGCKREQVIKIATQTPLSGSTKDAGTDIKNAAQLAIEQLSGPLQEMGIKVELVPFDDQASPEKGVENANAIVADAAILAVIGHYDSGVQIPASEVYHGAQLCNISPANTHPDVTDRGYPEINRICGRDDVQGAVGAQLAKKRGITKAFVLHDTTPWGQGIAEVFKAQAESLGIAVVGMEGTTDKAGAPALVSSIVRQRPDAVYLAAGYEMAGILKTLRTKGFKGMFISVDGFDSPEAANLAGTSLQEGEGTYFSTVAGPVMAYPGTAKFAIDFKLKYGSSPSPYTAQAYDCTAMALKAIEEAAKANDGKVPARAEVSKAVRALKGFQGTTGLITFNAKGDPITARYFVIQVTTSDPSRWVSNRVDQMLDIAPPQ